MNDKRMGRISHELMKVLSHAISFKLKDPKVAPITSVTGVEISSDLSYADVFVSILGADWDKLQTLEGLDKARGFLKNEIAHEVKLRQIPELRFHLDDSIEHGMYMDSLIEQTLAQDRESQKERADRGLDEEPWEENED